MIGCIVCKLQGTDRCVRYGLQTYFEIRTTFRHTFRDFSVGQNVDALIWVLYVFQNELKMSQIDSSRDLGYSSILNRRKQPDIQYFTTKLIILNLRASFLFKLFLFIGKSVGERYHISVEDLSYTVTL